MNHRRAHDPRVVRSQERLRAALLSLTLERGWDDVSVQDVCARAGVGRSTFYVHFADREDLLLAAFRSDHIVPRRTLLREPFAFVQPLVAHVDEHRSLYRALVGTSCEPRVNERFRHVVAELVEAELSARARPSLQRTAATRYLAGAVCETLTFWLGQRERPAAREIERLLTQFSLPVVERLQ